MSTIDMNDLVAKRNEKKTDELNKLTENIRETASEIVGEVHDILESIDKPGLSHDEKIAARKDALKRLREIRAGRQADRTNPGEPPAASSAQPKPKGPKSDAPKAKPAPAPKQEPVAAKEESQPVIVPTATKEPAPEPEKSGKDKFFNFFQGVSPGGAHK